MNNTELAERLFESFEQGDVDAARSICHADMKAFQNLDPPMDLDALMTFSLSVGAIVKDFRYTDAVRSATATGFVEEHNVRGTLPDGSDLHIAACVVAEVKEGQITVLREYLDTSAARGLARALVTAG